MLHNLPLQLMRKPWGRKALQVVAVLFVLFQASYAVRPFLPRGALSRGNFPWGMFKDASRDNKEVVAWGFTEDGEKVDIDLTRFFKYRRGTTNLRIYDHHPALMENRRWHRTEKRAFARWLAREVWLRDGVKLKTVVLKRIRRRINSSRVREQDILTLDIEPVDFELEVPREARVNAP